jgi:hypothetical protein
MSDSLFSCFFALFCSYLNMAEIRFLQGRIDASTAYWSECKDTLFALFMNGSQSVLGLSTHRPLLSIISLF